ncbi:MAG: branched-chain amino acid ABC transporter ATP-binding protein [Thermoproteota archaeon]|nr:MAG: branched-chain amino acid ABC transporter ATP-binding protein [Candidatus Korarchaeota archaeon]
MLKLKGINSGYGARQILYDISMDLKGGEITVIIGPNGAGKTTLLRTIMGLIDIYSGEILFDGKNIVGMPTNKIVRLGISYVPQRDNIFDRLTVKENLMIGGYLLSKEEKKKRMEEILSFFPVLGRKEYFNRKAGKLSGGERKMLALARGLMKKPKIILLDEPTEGLMPKLTMEVYDRIKEIRKETGAKIIMTEEKAQFALELGDDAYLLVGGRIQDNRNAKEMLNDPYLREKYFGILGEDK